MFKKSIAAIALSVMMILSFGTGAFAADVTIVSEVPKQEIVSSMSDDVIAAIEDVNKVNVKIEAEIAKNQERADKLYNQYEKKLAKETDAEKQEQLTAKYEKQISDLIFKLQEKAERMTVKGIEKAEAAGLTVDMVYVDIKFGNKNALIDPIVVVSW
ncbi:DUF3450 domain-containing protein [Planococcus sp. ISL-109]|uniref:DUF3450 domain-containing protein n=1 Tax=Planococcus sp. ISL-109 TaxID=2819166 RepID=UPI001BED2D0B|nr:DUF3450 domain-containing protein [Planococcus sp. ISL-109]MBT2582760.1 hypothetical protein [Planococcus sp. ISL-109]